METPNYYAVIPADVRYDPRLKPNEKLFYGELTALAQKDGYCFATNRYFSNLYGVAKETVSRWVSHLKELGYIGVDMVMSTTGEIDMRRIIIFPKIVNTYCGKSQDPYCGKSQGTYITIQDINNTPIPPEGVDLFQSFWEAYPKHKGKEPARKAFRKLKATDELLETILSAVEREKRSDQWKRDNGQYIPYPATWLNQRRWEDEPDGEPDPDTPGYLTRYL